MICPAVNIIRIKYDYWYKNVATSEMRKEQDEGKLLSATESFSGFPISKQVVDQGDAMELDTSKPLEMKCPVKIIHGVRDEIVPYKNSFYVMKMISNDNVELIFQKSGDHRLSTDASLELILRSLDDMVLKM